jgi:hypothetical protein
MRISAFDRTRVLSRWFALLLSLSLFLLLSCGKEDKKDTGKAPADDGSKAEKKNTDKPPEGLEGTLDGFDADSVSGWAWDPKKPETPIKVDLYDDDKKFATVPADEFRKDLLEAKKGNGKHGFLYALPKSLKDGKEHTIRAKFEGTDKELDESPKKFKAKS